MSVVGAIGGAALDQVVGEPPLRWHPVAKFGSLMLSIERRCYADKRRNGVLFALVGVGVGVVTGMALRRVAGPRLATMIATSAAVAGKMLDSEARRVAELMQPDRDLDAARTQLQSLVGRNTAELDESGISRAVVESLAENCVDAVTASLFWASVGGAPGAIAHRCANTLDAMVGHRNERYEHFGWASARFDDLINYVPARLTVLGVVMARPTKAREIARFVRRDASKHPSPNGGVVEAAFAAALGVRLGGVNHYNGEVEDRGTLGDGPVPSVGTITAAIRLRQHCTMATVALWAIPAALHRTARR